MAIQKKGQIYNVATALELTFTFERGHTHE